MKYRFEVGQQVRAVRGPGGSMEAEPRSIGREGVVVEQLSAGPKDRFYGVEFTTADGPTLDYSDEVCLERV